jgi:hypothetical protein
VPRNRSNSFNVGTNKASPTDMPLMTPTSAMSISGSAQPPFAPQDTPRGASALLSPESNPAQIPIAPVSAAGQGTPLGSGQNWSQSIEGVDIIRPKSSFYDHPQALHDHSHTPFTPFPGANVATDPNELAARNNFAMWLFDPQRSFGDLNMTNMPFLEGGLESTFNNNIQYENESLASQSQLGLTPPRLAESPDELMPEFRRQEIISWIRIFRRKQKKDPLCATLLQDSGNDIAGLSSEMLRQCIRQYWDQVSPRLPIVHQPTFSTSGCSILLLMVMVALGASSLHSQDTTGMFKEHGFFADLIITCVRWEILTADEASPPVALWVAQALLLLEFYEKMCSTRKLHERAHIYHTVTLTLLRRGSPLIGRAGSESPPDLAPASEHESQLGGRAAWIRWAETEAMHRVVFAAFMMDVVHAAMFGHAADMAPHEIRLPLPCDDKLWSATSPEDLRQQEAGFRMYGVKTVSFLDGLKSALHGKEVQTHSFGRMIIMSGLLSVGWHLSHRETHLKWLELSSSNSEQRERWYNMLLKAFDDWKVSFDSAIGSQESASTGEGRGSNGLIQSAAVLYHLAHVSLWVNIIDCQVFAGAKRLIGRKISTRDYSNVVSRMRVWSAQPSTRHAVLHAFKLLNWALADPRQRKTLYHNGNTDSFGCQYSCRTDPDPHRPWIMYYATLAIWSYVRAQTSPTSPQLLSPHMRRSNNVQDYLSNIAALRELGPGVVTSLQDGLPALLDTIGSIASEAHSELLQEAHTRLAQCKELLSSGPP